MGVGVGGIVSSALSFASQKIQHDFQEEMFKQRYQLTVRDMRKAGLNPILAATHGISGTFAGGAAAANLPNLGMTLAAGQQAKTSAREVARKTAKLDPEKVLLASQAAAQDAQAGTARAIAAREDMARRLLEHQEPGAMNKRDFELSRLGKTYQSMGGDRMGTNPKGLIAAGAVGTAKHVSENIDAYTPKRFRPQTLPREQIIKRFEAGGD